MNLKGKRTVGGKFVTVLLGRKQLKKCHLLECLTFDFCSEVLTHFYFCHFRPKNIYLIYIFLFFIFKVSKKTNFFDFFFPYKIDKTFSGSNQNLNFYRFEHCWYLIKVKESFYFFRRLFVNIAV